jgi:hypothetical protein
MIWNFRRGEPVSAAFGDSKWWVTLEVAAKHLPLSILEEGVASGHIETATWMPTDELLLFKSQLNGICYQQAIEIPDDFLVNIDD